MMSPDFMPGMKPSNRCRSEPHMAQLETLTIASRGCSMIGSGTVPHRMSFLPCHVSALIAFLRDQRGGWADTKRSKVRRVARIGLPLLCVFALVPKIFAVIALGDLRFAFGFFRFVARYRTNAFVDISFQLFLEPSVLSFAISISVSGP
jgi:hypothetical protein